MGLVLDIIVRFVFHHGGNIKLETCLLYGRRVIDSRLAIWFGNLVSIVLGLKEPETCTLQSQLPIHKENFNSQIHRSSFRRISTHFTSAFHMNIIFFNSFLFEDSPFVFLSYPLQNTALDNLPFISLILPSSQLL